MSNGQALVSGEIVFEDSTASFSDAVINVRLEDVSLADAPAKTLAWEQMRAVSYAGAAIPFRLDAPTYDDRARYNLSVHISLHGGDEMRPGDYITVQAYPVLTYGYPKHRVVEVRKI